MSASPANALVAAKINNSENHLFFGIGRKA
jgi:hypothetical protein